MYIDFFKLSNKLKNIYSCDLLVCLSTYARCSSRKYSCNILKFMYVIQIYFKILHAEIFRINDSRIEAYKRI